MADGLEKAFAKTEKLGIPIHEMSVIVMIAFRFIPIMLDELNLLMDAQAARGAKFGEGSIIEKCKGVITLLLPLFLMTVRRSSDLAMAMEARCYHGGEGRTKMKPLKYCRKDRIAYITVIAYVVLVVLIGRFVPLHIWVF